MAKDGPLMATVYRADTIGSLLRPPYLKLAREQFEAGQLEPAAYVQIEDRAVDQGARRLVRPPPVPRPRDRLRALFELAEDSAAELDSYIDAGRVLVATSDGEIIGHLQLTGTDDPRQVEIKNMAVREACQGQGVGRLLIQAAADLVVAEAVTTILVATASADIGNLRFYQRQGFRMRSVERDAFTPATGYPPGLLIDGIELRDRVWLDRMVLSGVEPGPQ